MSEKTLSLDARQENCEDAVRYAKAHLAEKNREQQECTLDVTYDPRLVAGVAVTLQGFGQFSGKYVIKKAVHRVGASGSKVSLTLYRAGPSLESRFSVRRTSDTPLAPAGGASASMPSIAAALRDAVSAKAWSLPAKINHAAALEAYKMLDVLDDPRLQAVESLASAASTAPLDRLRAELFAKWLVSDDATETVPFTVSNLQELILSLPALAQLRDSLTAAIPEHLDALPVGSFDFISLPCGLWSGAALCSATAPLWPSVEMGLLAAGEAAEDSVRFSRFMLYAQGQFNPMDIEGTLDGTELTRDDFAAYRDATGRGSPFTFYAKPVELSGLKMEYQR